MNKKMLISLFLLVFIPNAYAASKDIFEVFHAQQLEVVPDTVEKRVRSMLLFLSSEENLKMQASLIEAFGPGATYYIVKSPLVDPEVLLSRIRPDTKKQVQIRFIDYDRCFTPWVQDYFLRLYSHKQQKPILAPTESINLMINECKPYELGIADKLENVFETEIGALEPVDYRNFETQPSFFAIKRIDQKSGDIYGNSQAYRGFYPIRFFKYFQGEGGMRVPTPSYLFIERLDLRDLYHHVKGDLPGQNNMELKSSLEKLYRKELISVGDYLPENKYYSYHIDIFLTPIERQGREMVVFLGHPRKTRQILGNESLASMPYYDQVAWAEKEKFADLIEMELKDKGFRVRQLPILFIKKNGKSVEAITFNNGIQSMDAAGKQAFYMPDYDIPVLNSRLNLLRKAVISAFAAEGIQSHFVAGGENFLGQNGQLRCSTGVLSYYSEVVRSH